MSEPLNVDADGLRRASGRSDDLASELNSSNGASFAGGSQPTAGAVQAVHGLISQARADHTMALDEICALPVKSIAADSAHLYLWVPSSMLPEGLKVMSDWGFRYTTSLTWLKTRRDGEPDGSGVGFYFRNATESLLFGVRGSLRTLPAARSMTNVISARRREHSRKPTAAYWLIEQSSPGPRLELFAREGRDGWVVWGDESDGVSGRFRPETRAARCPVCRGELPQPSTGRRRLWCSEACRKRYRRAVAAGS